MPATRTGVMLHTHQLAIDPAVVNRISGDGAAGAPRDTRKARTNDAGGAAPRYPVAPSSATIASYRPVSAASRCQLFAMAMRAVDQVRGSLQCGILVWHMTARGQTRP
jgi:hypothetical protein